MSDARQLVEILGGEVTGPSEALVPGPGHSAKDRSLHVSFGAGDFVCYSFAGDGFKECRDYVRQALGRAHDFSSRAASDRRARIAAPAQDGRERNRAKALEIWRSSVPAAGTPVEVYLRSRGINLPVPATIRFHAALWHPETGKEHAAMVCAVSGPDRSLLSVHRTYLQPDGSGKLGVKQPKLALGCMGHGAVRLAPAGPVLGITKGVEDALSAMQIDQVPVWAVLGAARLPRIDIPPITKEIRVYADNNPAGREWAAEAQQAHTKLDITTNLILPPSGHVDWNAYLAEQGGQHG